MNIVTLRSVIFMFSVVTRSPQEGVQRDLEVLQVLEGQVEPCGEAAHDKVGDAMERLVSRQRQ